MTEQRRPAALLPPAVARLLGFALLAGVGALQWARYVDGESVARPLSWVATGLAAAVLILLSQRLRRWAGAAALLALLLGLGTAVIASGVRLHYLKPAHWDEFAEGIGTGLQSLGSVRLPYIGKDPWVVDTVELSGALMCALAAALAVWPRGRGAHRTGALVLLMVLAASPIVSIGAVHGVALGLALAALTACFLWLERVARRPGLGLAVLGVAALAAAIPLGAAADREEPWLDYRSLAENWGTGHLVTYDWDHSYGPIDWPREGAELFRARSALPLYWKAQELGYFDGNGWSDSARAEPGGDEPTDDLPRNYRRNAKWNVRFQVSLKALKTPSLVGAGTVLRVTGSSRPVEQGVVPGVWMASGASDLTKGDSYIADAYVPRPTAIQLAAATVGKDARRAGMLQLHVAFRPDALALAPLAPQVPARPPRHLKEAEIQFASFEASTDPVAHYRLTGLDGPGSDALEHSFYDRTWSLARALRRRATSPYDYVLRVNALLHGPEFRYTEVPPRPGAEAPLEFFLFDSHEGYCQQFSGAMALLLRMGGIPARVASGFSPGGRRDDGQWIVRDTDAHSWVEAWFDGLGWVTLDPTPPATPARSLIAAIAIPKDKPREGQGSNRPNTNRPLARRPEGLNANADRTLGAKQDKGGFPVGRVVLGALAALALALLAFVLARRARLPRDAHDRALAELQRALRRSGRAVPEGMTLIQLERRLGISGNPYLRALRTVRYAPRATQPTRADRAAFRRDLALGLGWRGRLLALWALPPAVTLRRPPR